MKRIPTILAPGLLLVMLACSLFSPSSPQIMADIFFFGHAYVDSDGDGELDPEDDPLPGALFSAAGFSARTDSRGIATIVIPGGWDGPAIASMAPPEGSAYTLIGPHEVELRMDDQISADFLFAAPPVTPTVAPPARRATPAATHHDLVYCTTEDGVELKMDLYQPERADAPSPLVLLVHGGGWTGGDKRDGLNQLFTPALRARGYLVASINYRLSPRHKFPAHIEDVRCAVRYLRANAERYNLDPARVAGLGASAGGHLVALLGTVDETPPWEAGRYLDGYPNDSSRIQAVVDLFGPADLDRLTQGSGHLLDKRIFGVDQAGDPRLEPFSPVNYITADDPPFLILHGEEDGLVPPEQSQVLYDQLVAAGVPAELVIVGNAGHGFTPSGGEIDPSIRELGRMVVEFLDQYLK
jgi:acetyl esterase/lipase